VTHGNSKDISTHDRVGEGADNETLLAAIAVVVDGDDFARLTTPTLMRKPAQGRIREGSL